MDSALPVLMTTGEIARLLGWNRQRTLRWMKRHDIAIKDGSRYVTTRTKLREAFPDVYHDQIETLTGDEDG